MFMKTKATLPKFGMMKRLKQGLWNGQPPYGYKVTNGKLEINPEEDQIVKKVFELYVEIITNYLVNFVNIYEDLELGEKKLLLECFVKKVEIEKSKEIKLTLQIPLEKFRVFIPDISATGHEIPGSFSFFSYPVY